MTRLEIAAQLLAQSSTGNVDWALTKAEELIIAEMKRREAERVRMPAESMYTDARRQRQPHDCPTSNGCKAWECDK